MAGDPFEQRAPGGGGGGPRFDPDLAAGFDHMPPGNFDLMPPGGGFDQVPPGGLDQIPPGGGFEQMPPGGFEQMPPGGFEQMPGRGGAFGQRPAGYSQSMGVFDDRQQGFDQPHPFFFDDQHQGYRGLSPYAYDQGGLGGQNIGRGPGGNFYDSRNTKGMALRGKTQYPPRSDEDVPEGGSAPQIADRNAFVPEVSGRGLPPPGSYFQRPYESYNSESRYSHPYASLVRGLSEKNSLQVAVNARFVNRSELLLSGANWTTSVPPGTRCSDLWALAVGASGDLHALGLSVTGTVLVSTAGNEDVVSLRWGEPIGPAYSPARRYFTFLAFPKVGPMPMSTGRSRDRKKAQASVVASSLPVRGSPSSRSENRSPGPGSLRDGGDSGTCKCEQGNCVCGHTQRATPTLPIAADPCRSQRHVSFQVDKDASQLANMPRPDIMGYNSNANFNYYPGPATYT
jgi:hypothetical protein